MTREETIKLLRTMRNFFPSFYNGADAREMVDTWEQAFGKVDCGIVRRAMFECSLGKKQPPTLPMIIGKIEEYQIKLEQAKVRYEYYHKALPQNCQSCDVTMYFEVLEKCGAKLCPRMEEWQNAKQESEKTINQVLYLISDKSELDASQVYLLGAEDV